MGFCRPQLQFLQFLSTFILHLNLSRLRIGGLFFKLILARSFNSPKEIITCIYRAAANARSTGSSHSMLGLPAVFSCAFW